MTIDKKVVDLLLHWLPYIEDDEQYIFWRPTGYGGTYLLRDGSLVHDCGGVYTKEELRYQLSIDNTVYLGIGIFHNFSRPGK